MTDKTPCQSCGLPIESGPYCTYCTDDDGQLFTFTETFERMVQFTMRNQGETDREVAARQTLDHMSRMPSWKEHPELLARLGR